MTSSAAKGRAQVRSALRRLAGPHRAVSGADRRMHSATANKQHSPPRRRHHSVGRGSAGTEPSCSRAPLTRRTRRRLAVQVARRAALAALAGEYLPVSNKSAIRQRGARGQRCSRTQPSRSAASGGTLARCGCVGAGSPIARGPRPGRLHTPGTKSLRAVPRPRASRQPSMRRRTCRWFTGVGGCAGMACEPSDVPCDRAGERGAGSA